jgi:beta-glucosidase
MKLHPAAARCIVGPVLALLLGAGPVVSGELPRQPEIGHRAKPVITQNGLRFHDLDGDGRLSRFEDWRLAPAERATDLIGRMTRAEKAGLLMHGTPPTTDGLPTGRWDVPSLQTIVARRHIRFFISRQSGDPATLADMANAVQQTAEASRLGIPVVLSSDPRHQVRSTFGVSTDSGQFSLWPEASGFGAIGDPALMERAAAIMAREYRAVGLHMALSPMADLASEPRWSRANGTFGDDPVRVGQLAAAYVAGMQGSRRGLAPHGVATVAKHWVGYGAQPKGLDAHNPYGRQLAFPAGRFDDHVKAFLPVLAAETAGVMPTYGILPDTISIAGKPAEPVAGGYNRALLTGLLRGRHGFEGFVLSDWKITDDCLDDCRNGTMVYSRVGMPWGVENLTRPERFAKAMAAGVDQFGGVMDEGIILDLLERGVLADADVDRSVRRLLTVMFRLGLFENAYVDPSAAAAAVGTPAARAAGIAAQKRSLTLLANNRAILPLAPGRRRVWLSGLSADAARAAGLEPVASPEAADVIIMRVATPYTTHAGFFFGSRYHEGMPEFLAGNPVMDRIAAAARSGKPVIVSVYMDRPAIVTALLPHVSALLADYGIEDQALLEVIAGKGAPDGQLPFELPRSAAAVMAQQPDAPSDSANPLFKRGHRLRYNRSVIK